MKAIKHILFGLLVGAAASPLIAATYPNGKFAYPAPPLAVLPAVPPSGTYKPGTYDDSGIQAAIDKAAAAGGGAILLNSGTYTINHEVILKSNMVIQGQGMGKTVLQRGPAFAYQTGTTSPTWVGLLSNSNAAIHDVKIMALTVDGNLTAIQRANLTPGFLGIQVESDATPANHNLRVQLSSVEVMNCGQGVSMKGATEITFWNGKYHDNGGGNLYFHNIYFRRAGDITLTGVSSYNSGAHGIKIAGGTSNYPNESENINISGCTLQNNGYVGMYFTGISHSRIYNNTVDYSSALQNSSVSGGAALLLGSENSVACDTMDFVNNLVQYNYAYGIRVYSTSNLNVQGNRCNSNASANYDVHASNLTCDYNTQ